MSPASVTTKDVQQQVGAVAAAYAKLGHRDRAGRSKAICVRVPSVVEGMLNAAKPDDQPLPEFLRECAVMVALQRLEESQN